MSLKDESKTMCDERVEFIPRSDRLGMISNPRIFSVQLHGYSTTKKEESDGKRWGLGQARVERKGCLRNRGFVGLSPNVTDQGEKRWGAESVSLV